MRQAPVRSPVVWLLLLAGAVLVAACGGSTKEPAPLPAVEAPEVGPAGVLVEIEGRDLPTGEWTTSIFYNDIPGYLSEVNDSDLAALPAEAREAGGLAGQGFHNPATGEFFFLVTLAFEDAARALEVIGHLDALAVDRIFEFISPDDVLFEAERLSDPDVGDGAVQYFLRYGVFEGDARTRDVGTDLIIFAKGGSVVFMQRSVNLRNDPVADADALDLVAISQLLVDRIGEELLRQAISAP